MCRLIVLGVYRLLTHNYNYITHLRKCMYEKGARARCMSHLSALLRRHFSIPFHGPHWCHLYSLLIRGKMDSSPSPSFDPSLLLTAPFPPPPLLAPSRHPYTPPSPPPMHIYLFLLTDCVPSWWCDWCSVYYIQSCGTCFLKVITHKLSEVISPSCVTRCIAHQALFTAYSPLKSHQLREPHMLYIHISTCMTRAPN